MLSMKVAKDFLAELRQAIRREGLCAIVIPSGDAHNSEYQPACSKARHLLTNFYGTAGTALVTEDSALLWTDGRYWLEAGQCLSSDWTLMREGAPGVPSLDEWLADNAPKPLGKAADTCPLVAVDTFATVMARWESMGKCSSITSTKAVAEGLQRAYAVLRSGTGHHARDTPAPIYQRHTKYSGETAYDRICKVMGKLIGLKCDAAILSALDDIAWLTNLRGGDVEYNPVFTSYVYLTARGALAIFVDLEKLKENNITPAAVSGGNTDVSVSFHPYEDLEGYLREYCAPGTVVAVESTQTSRGVYDILIDIGAVPKDTASKPIVKCLKSIKTEAEIQGMKTCHKRDGCALIRYLAWLTHEIEINGRTDITEFDGAEKLESFRKEEDLFVQPSFGTISSSGPNGAIIHYCPTSDKCDIISADKLYLIDSGGQYFDGTTDVTRVLAFNAEKTPRPQIEREAYTLVLKGHIALNTAVFPQGVAGFRLDALARQYLWQYGLDYVHGTGHGVGSFLNVHEGPQSIGKTSPALVFPLEKGMIVSNEPGYYEDGKFGIRIENLELLVEKETPYNNNVISDGHQVKSLGMEYLTLVPLSNALIIKEMLSDKEIDWVNCYHNKIKEEILPLIQNKRDMIAEKFLLESVEPL